MESTLRRAVWRMRRARLANLSVFSVSSYPADAGVAVQRMATRAFPPRDAFRMRVSLLLR